MTWGLGKDEGSREGENNKACLGDSKEEKKSVCAWGMVGREREGARKETVIGDI